MIPNFRQVSPKLYRSAAPTAQAQVNWLINGPSKVRKIISLDRTAGMLLARMLPPNIQHIPLYIDFNAPSINAAGNKLKEAGGKIFDPPGGMGSTLVHCRRGVDRTGFAVAIYRVRKQGWSPAAAIREAESLQYGSGLEPAAKALMNQIVGLTPETATGTEEETADISDADDIVTYMREQGHNQGPSSTVADTSNPVIDQTRACRYTALMMPEGESYPPVNIRARMKKLNNIIKEAAEKSAVIIKGTQNDNAESFYVELKRFLMSIGYYVTIVEHGGLPPVADLWIGCGKGADALRVAPESVQQLALKPSYHLSSDTISVIKALDKDMSKKDVNEALLGGGPIGSPTQEQLPSGQGSPAIPNAPTIPASGLRSDYQGSIPGTNYGATGGTPGTGSPGGLVDIDPYGLVQL